MKLSKSFTVVFSLLIALMFFSSCNKDEQVYEEITEEDAVEIIESSMQKSTGGITETTEKYAEDLENDITLNDLCNTPYNESYTFTNNGIITANYTFNWQYELACSDPVNIPQSATFSANSSGSYNTQRINSNDSSESAFAVTGLQPGASFFVFNGTYKRAGSQDITTSLNARSISSELNMTLGDIFINKSTFEIDSGSGNFTLTGTNQGNSFSFEGSLLFNGNGVATLILNGNTYQIDIN